MGRVCHRSVFEPYPLRSRSSPGMPTGLLVPMVACGSIAPLLERPSFQSQRQRIRCRDADELQSDGEVLGWLMVLTILLSSQTVRLEVPFHIHWESQCYLGWVGLYRGVDSEKPNLSGYLWPMPLPPH